MPTYEFKCPLGHEFEKMEKMSAKGTVKCPICGKQARRVISGGAGFVFKGSGFYQTDYKHAGKAESASEKSDKADAKIDKTNAKAESPKAEKAEKQTAAPDKKAEKPADKPKTESKPKKADS